ncbi:MAG: ParB/RepB/Spo0J family partition protein [Bacilli bacterium]|nr:ParB/RepB/Spo0J family partition protein [Bacilli bacterium]
METKKKALGKGLEQLFSNSVIDFNNFEKEVTEEAQNNGDVTEIELGKIISNPYQPRKVFDEEALEELAASIKEYGIVQPIIVKKSVSGYELVAGERRTKAARLAGLKTIPAIIKEFNDQEMMEIALIENIQRENLNPIEEAISYENIIKLRGYTQEEFAKKFGKSRSHVTNLLGLLSLSEKVKEMVAKKQLTMGHARALSKVADEEKVIELANKIVNEGLSVREIEKILTNQDMPKRNKIKTKEVDYHYTMYENILREKIGTKVKIAKNKVEIPFDSLKDLERILEIINIDLDND